MKCMLYLEEKKEEKNQPIWNVDEFNDKNYENCKGGILVCRQGEVTSALGILHVSLKWLRVGITVFNILNLCNIVGMNDK